MSNTHLSQVKWNNDSFLIISQLPMHPNVTLPKKSPKRQKNGLSRAIASKSQKSYCVKITESQQIFHMYNVNKKNTRKRCEICSKLTIKTPERRHWLCSGVFSLLNLNMFLTFLSVCAVKYVLVGMHNSGRFLLFFHICFSFLQIITSMHLMFPQHIGRQCWLTVLINRWY